MVLLPILLYIFCFINCPIPSLCVFRVTIRLGRRPFRNKTFVGDNSSHRCHSANMNTFEPGENTEQLTRRVDKWDCAPYWGLIRTGYPENEQVRFGDNASVSWFFQYAANGYEKKTWNVIKSIGCLTMMSFWDLVYCAGCIFAMMILLRLQISMFSYFTMRHISLQFISCI